MRIVGVDRIPATPFERGAAARKPVLTPLQQRTRKAKRALAARGLVEAVTWSFIAKPQAELFGGGKPELALANPIAADLSDMRPSLVPGLVAAAQRNADRGFGDVALFEVGQIFRGDQPADQLTAAAGVRRARAKASGGLAGIGRTAAPRSMPSTSRPMRSPCSSAAGAPDAGAADRARADRPGCIPAARGTIQIGPQNVLGYFGELHPRALEALDAERPAGGLRGDPRTHSRSRRPRRRGPSPRSSSRPSSRSSATSPSWSIAPSRPADIVRAAQSRRPQADRRRQRVRRLRGRGHRARQEVASPSRSPAAAREDHDGRGDRGGRRRRSWPRSARGPAARCADSAAQPLAAAAARAVGAVVWRTRRSRRSAASAARSPDSQAPPTVPHSVSCAASPANQTRSLSGFHQDLARRLAAGRGGREGAERPRLVVPVGRVPCA